MSNENNTAILAPTVCASPSSMTAPTESGCNAERNAQDDEDMGCAMMSACISFLCGDLDNSTDY